jgi:hypothetical protein
LTKLGATGDYPLGKLNDTDEGALQIAIRGEGGNVRIDFGTPTAWLAMPPDQAIAFAEVIIAKANLIKRGQR